LPFITVAELDSVRRAIDVTVTAAVLPDAVLLDPVSLGVTDRAVLARDPDAATRTGAEAEAVTAAAVYWHASLFAPTVPVLVSERVTDYQYQRQPFDRAARAAWLRSMAEELLAALSVDVVDGPRPPVVFDLAPGFRGRWR
jgi:hypothetical protein